MSVNDIEAIRSEFRSTIETRPDVDALLWQLLGQVPEAQVTTYGDLATALGDRVASRWVGYRLLHHESDAECKCHRVVRAGGDLGRYAHGTLADKAAALTEDQVAVDRHADQRRSVQHFASRRFTSFVSSKPLIRLRDLQHQMVALHKPQNVQVQARIVAGVDLSYAGEIAVAAYSLFDVTTGERLRTITVRCPTKFPYITSYLSFRELPALLAVIEAAAETGVSADVVLVDGSGSLHPRRAGVATLLGMLIDQPTVGVTKKILVGSYDKRSLRYDNPVPIVDEAKLEQGRAFLPNTTTTKPIFVSPGYKIDVASAADVVKKCLRGRRLPDPIYWADRESRREAKSIGSRH